MPDRLKDSDFLKCPLDVSELISSSMNNPSIKGLSELHRKQWYNMLPYFRGLYIRFYDFVYAKAILAVFSLIFSLQTRSSILHIAPDQPRPKDNMFFLLFQLFQSTKIPNMDDNFRTNWISADVVRVSVWQVELLTTFHSLSTDDTACESVLCSVTFKISVCLCVSVFVRLWYLRDMSRTETLHHCHPIYMHTLFPFKHAPTCTANFSFIRFRSFYTVTHIHNCVCVNCVSDNNHPITFHYCQHLLFVTWQKFN